MPLYSFSQIQTYLQCPLKYRFRYVDKIVPEFEENLHLILGTEVHSALEWLYKQLNDFKKPKIEELEEVFESFFNQKAEKLDVADEEKETFLVRGKNYLKSYYQKHYPFEDVKVVGTEIQLYIDLGDSIKFQGFIDRLDKEGNSFVIVDYKTNKNLPPEDKTLYEEQLTLYALGIKQKYGKYFDKLYGKLVYLHFDLVDFWEITEEKIFEISQKYKNLAKEIENKKVEYNLGHKEAFEAKESTSCKYCDYKEICPLFAHFYGNVEDVELSVDLIKKFVDEYVELNKKKKEIEKILAENKKVLIDYAKRNKLKKLFGEKGKLSVSSLKTFKILDKEKLKDYLESKKLLQQVMDIDRYKIQKLLKEKKLDLPHGLVELSETWILR